MAIVNTKIWKSVTCDQLDKGFVASKHIVKSGICKTVFIGTRSLYSSAEARAQKTTDLPLSLLTLALDHATLPQLYKANSSKPKMVYSKD
jgi:hypothetical protein